MRDFTLFEAGEAEVTEGVSSGDIIEYGLHAVGAKEVWGRTPPCKGEGVRVAVLDTGLVSHPDLPHVRNIHGNPDTHGHAFHVAGIIGAIDNGVGVVGVAPRCELMLYQLFPATVYSFAERIVQAAEDGADIINISGGTPTDYPPIREACERTVQRGVIIIAAAGNDPFQVQYPAAYPGVIAVSATGPDGKRAEFAPMVPNHVFCPGVSILSCWLDNKYARLSGTSQAAPLLTGVAALLFSLYRPTGDVAVATITRELVRLGKNDGFEYVPNLASL